MSKKDIEKVDSGLEIDEDISLQKTGWIVQRIGWAFIFLFVILASLGVFGDGIVSKTKNQISGSSIEYEKFHRQESRMDVKIEIQTNAGDEAVISFSNDYLKHFRLEGIVPEPRENLIENNMTHYTFNGKENIKVTFYLIPQEIGNISGNVRINNNQFSLNHFIYP